MFLRAVKILKQSHRLPDVLLIGKLADTCPFAFASPGSALTVHTFVVFGAPSEIVAMIFFFLHKKKVATHKQKSAREIPV